MEVGSKEGFVWYTPDFTLGEFDNRKAEESEQVQVEVHCLNRGESQKFRSMTTLKGNEKKGFKTNAADVEFKMFIANVRGIKNAMIKGKPCTGPGQLYKEGYDKMVDDIIKAIDDMSHLEEGEVKNSKA
jgi:hypothetical protein